MKGIQFVIDDAGNKKAVILDLDQWGELWEDIYDTLLHHARKDEPTVAWEDVKAEMDGKKPRLG